MNEQRIDLVIVRDGHHHADEIAMTEGLLCQRHSNPPI